MENPDTPIDHPFPPTGPDAGIAGSEEPIGAVGCVELRWWLAVPRPGHRTMRASYDADTLELAWIVDMEATALARVPGVG